MNGICGITGYEIHLLCITDDRFVIKEMTKNDIQVFENFAPNYFVYINQCLQTNQPTLLAKIFGVFKVNIKKKE